MERDYAEPRQIAETPYYTGYATNGRVALMRQAEGDYMKALVQVQEIDGEGLEGLLGKRVLILCAAYFYHGTLVGVNDKFIKLDDAAIVYETGPWDGKTLKDAQKIGDGHYVMIGAIESFREEPRR